MIALKWPEQEINDWAEDAPKPFTIALTQPGRGAQCFVRVAADHGVYKLIEGNQDIQDVSQHDYSVAAVINRSSICASVMFFCCRTISTNGLLRSTTLARSQSI